MNKKKFDNVYFKIVDEYIFFQKGRLKHDTFYFKFIDTLRPKLWGSNLKLFSRKPIGIGNLSTCTPFYLITNFPINYGIFNYKIHIAQQIIEKRRNTSVLWMNMVLMKPLQKTESIAIVNFNSYVLMSQTHKRKNS